MTDSTEPSGLDGHRRPSTYLSFTPYPLQAGDRITIESGPRHGDWEVIAVSERKVRPRCPFSGTEVEWDLFCYLAEECLGPWPHPDR